MTLEAIPEIEKISLSADWVELAALTSPRMSASSADLIRSRAVIEDDEHRLVPLDIDDPELVEEEILESATEHWASDVREEIVTRIDALGESYPFEISGSGQAWRLTFIGREDRHDHSIYVCCLLITANRFGLVLRSFGQLDKVLQVIAYLTAGQVVQGDSYWFGYPRPDGTRMGQAIERLLTRMGFKSPEVKSPNYSIDTENDGGIDVIAWRNFGDKLASRLVLYGQVASGKNWEGKPVRTYADSTFPDWVGDCGQRNYVPAMFIPWPQYVTVEAARGRSFRQRVLDLSIRNEKIYGLTLDRGRLAELAKSAVNTGNDDEADWLRFLSDWRTTALATLTG